MARMVRIQEQKEGMHLNREEKMLMPKKEIISSWLRSMRSLLLYSKSAMLKMMIIDLFNR